MDWVISSVSQKLLTLDLFFHSYCPGTGTDPPHLRGYKEVEGHLAKNSPLYCGGICGMLSSQPGLRKKSAGAGGGDAAVALKRAGRLQKALVPF